MLIYQISYKNRYHNAKINLQYDKILCSYIIKNGQIFNKIFFNTGNLRLST